MFGSAILDIAIGMGFIYLLLSLIVTAINELIEILIKMRASHLAKGLQKLLGSDKAKAFFEKAIIKNLSPNAWFGKGTRKPSYIPPRIFAATVLDLLVPAVVNAKRTLEQVQDAIASQPNELQQVLTFLLEE